MIAFARYKRYRNEQTNVSVTSNVKIKFDDMVHNQLSLRQISVIFIFYPLSFVAILAQDKKNI